MYSLANPIINENHIELVGQEVHCSVDWPLRYLHMRHHTALHILSGVVFQKYGSKITGGQIYPDRARLDFSLDDLTKEKVATIEAEVNRVISEDREVKIYWLTTEEALQRKEMYNLQQTFFRRDWTSCALLTL